MPISTEAIQRYLAHRGKTLPDVKTWSTKETLGQIYQLTGKYPQFKTLPRLPQLHGLYAALWARRFIAFFDMRMGKALRNDQLVATPFGWREIGTLRLGDHIFGRDGKTTKIIGIFPQGERPCLRITFSDDTVVYCDPEHSWSVNSAVRRSRGDCWQERTTAEIAKDRLRDPLSRTYRYFIPMPDPIQYPEIDLPIDPYTLGVLLGDGGLTQSAITLTTDQEIVDQHIILPQDCLFNEHARFENGTVEGHFIGTDRNNKLLLAMRALTLHGCKSNTKFIPTIYLRGSVEQRKALLMGLLDTDGWTEGQSGLAWGSTSKQLAYNMRELVGSLGGTFKINTDLVPKFTYKGETRHGKTFYSGRIRLPQSLGCPFKLSRKAVTWKPLTKFQPVRAIAKIEDAGSAEMTCIKVANKDGLFVTNDYVVTHNTKLALDWAAHLRLIKQWRGRGIVIAPAPALIDVWTEQALEHTTLKVIAAPTTHFELVDALESGNYDLLVVSIHTLQSMFTSPRTYTRKSKDITHLYPDYEGLNIFAKFFSLVIIDEIHRYGNPLGLWLQLAVAVTKNAVFRMGLTGTPWGRDPFRAWAQAMLIDDGETLGNNYFFFERAFGGEPKKNPFSLRKEVKFDKAKLPILNEKLASFSLAYKRADQGAGVHMATVALRMHGDQEAAYQDVLRQFIALPSGARKEIKNVFIRLRQVSSGYLPFTDDEGVERVVQFQRNAKREWLEDFASDLDPDIRVIFFTEFTPTSDMVIRVLKTHKVKHTVLRGDTKDKPGAIRAFQSGEVHAIVVNSQSGALGIDLSAADYQLFVETPIENIIREQAERRAQGEARKGRMLLIDDMIASPTERKILSWIKEGRNIMGSLYADPSSLV